MTDTPGAEPTVTQRWGLRWNDQAVVAGLTAVSLLSLAGWWFFNGGVSGRLVEIDGQPTIPYRYQVDPNRADWPELAQLPDIGEALARRIVESRNRDGPYRSPDDLLRVRGIGPKTLNNIRPYLRIE